MEMGMFMGPGGTLDPAAYGLSCADVGEFRSRVEAQLEALFLQAEVMVSVLDVLDGDPDFEEQHDRELDLDLNEGEEGGITADAEDDGTAEPLHGWSELTSQYDQTRLDRSSDLELQCEDEGADSDAEHSLGRSENIDQTRFEPANDDGEPWLGASADIDQRHWGQGDPYLIDREEQCEDEGANANAPDAA